jgi:Holliday junction resolvase-like predicted endonuclease
MGSAHWPDNGRISAPCHGPTMAPIEPSRSRTTSQRTGDAAEQLVADRLGAAGWTILGRNVRVSREELDLVAIDPGPPGALVLIEVRWRRTREFGLPEETFDYRKRRHLWSAAMRLVEAGQLPGGLAMPCLPIRVDLVVVEPPARPGGALRVRHHRDALAI